ncbi:MAG: leucine-rich repeat protein [Ruminococcus sp.]|nr:leucine-rich repeat protein [Ruminococcus sp.]
MKTWKNLLSIMLAFLLLISSVCVMPLSVSAVQNQLVKFENYEYILWGDGNASIYSCSTDEAEVVVPASIDGKKVSSVMSGAYSNNAGIKSVIVEEGIRFLEHESFMNCKNLEKVSLPSSLEKIGYAVFDGCSKLSDIEIPSNVSVIDDQAFSGCKSLAKINLPDSLEIIGEYAFCDCDSLTEITIPENAKDIKSEAFLACSSLDEINLPKGTQLCIGKDAFHDTAWYEAQPEGLMYIDGYVIGYKGRMEYNTELVFKDGAEIIGNDLFMNCSELSSVVFPDTMKTICSYTFKGCENLSSVTLPDSITHIGFGAFEECSNLKSITLPKNIQVIDASFRRTGIEKVEIPGTVIDMESAFASCYDLVEVTLGDNLSAISGYAFKNCVALESVVIPDSVTVIDTEAFAGCTNLKNVTFNGYIEDMGSDVFKDTGWFEASPDNMMYLNNVILGYNGRRSDLSKVVIKDGTTVIADGAFQYVEDLSEVVFPQGIKVIGDYSFYACNLGDLAIPDTVEYIGNFAFCASKLSSLVIEGDAQIGTRAFISCPNLKSVTLSASIDEIGSEALGTYFGMTAPVEKYEGFTIYGYEGSAAEEYAQEMDFRFIDLKNGIVGDADADGVITIKDATVIQKYTASLEELTAATLDFTDVDGDTDVNIKDATMIQKYIAGLTNRFNIGI